MRWPWQDKDPKSKSISELREELAITVDAIFAIDPIANLTIRQIVFDTKYKGDLEKAEEFTPTELIARFKVKADRGDNTFLRHYFYRVLRKNNDPVIRKLKYRLKRNN